MKTIKAAAIAFIRQTLLKGLSCPARLTWLKALAIDRSLLKGEALRFSAHPLSCGRPFKFWRHLVRPLGMDNIIAMQDINIHSAIFN